MAAYNIDSLGFKAIAKRTAKQAGLGLLNNLGGSSNKNQAIGAPPPRPPPPSQGSVSGGIYPQIKQ